MSNVPNELRDDIPAFDKRPLASDHGPIDWTGLTSVRTAKSALEIGSIQAVSGRNGDLVVRGRAGDRLPGTGLGHRFPQALVLDSGEYRSAAIAQKLVAPA